MYQYFKSIIKFDKITILSNFFFMGDSKMEEKIKYFTQAELKSIFRAIEKSEDRHWVRNLALCRIAYRCALRVSELSLIQLQDYNKAKGELYCRRLKGSLNNTIRLDHESIKALNTYIRAYEVKDSFEALFKSQEGKAITRQMIDIIIKKYCAAAQIEDKSKWHFHTLKHSMAVHLAESNLDIKELQWWLGHKNVNNSLIYFSFTTTQQQQLYKKLNKNNYLV